MFALAGTAGFDGMHLIVNIPGGYSAPDLVGSFFRAFTQAGITIADKNNVLNFCKIFSHKYKF
jgi:hypothetical protein